MASLTRARFCTLLTNFSNVLIKKSPDLHKNHVALFHCSVLLNGPGQEIKMPSLSPTMVEGKIVKWLKKEGDTISPGDVLCDIETDKAIVSMETEEEGILAKIIVPENSPLIKVGSLIALMVAEGEDWKNVDIPSGAGVSTSGSSSSIDSSSSSSSSGSDSDEKGSTTISGPPTTPVTMPSLSPTMTSGTIVKWLKKEGDTIAPGDVLCDIQTDKAVMSMETEEEGILAKIILPDDSKDVKVGTLIALIVPEGEDWKSVVVTSSPSEPKKSSSQAQPGPSEAVPSGDIRGKSFGPAVKSLLSVYQIEPGVIKPSGRGNRILKEDVMKYIQDNNLVKKPPATAAAPTTESKATPEKPDRTPKQPKTVPGSKYTDIEVTNMRQVIAKRLVESKRQIPHSYSMVKCNVDKLIEAKNSLSAEGVKVSVNDLLTKATALALQIYPKANALVVNNEVKISNTVDICVAVATESGLYTPIIKATNTKSVTDISQELRELAGRAKSNKLKPEEFQGGTFTISNLGMFGITHFKAIINPPQCGILAVGSTIETLDSELNIRKHMVLSLSYDRRALQEHEAGEFMDTLKYVIENPQLVVPVASYKSSQFGL